MSQLDTDGRTGDTVAAPPRWWWLALALPAMVLFACYQYVDNAATTQHGMNVWRSLSEGKLLSFYSYNDAFTPESPYFWHFGSQYGFLLYVVFAVWNLPLFLAERFWHVPVFTNFATLMWAKAITLPLYAALVWVMGRLGRTLGLSKAQRDWAAFLVVSSTFVAETVLIMGQYDVVHMIPSVLAVDAWLRGKRRGFVGWFALAICFKWFPVLLFVPLLLLAEKRVRVILRDLACALVPVIALMVPFAFDHARAKGGPGLMQGMLLAGALPLGHGLSVFVAVAVACCLAAWLAPALSDDDRSRWGMLAASAPFFALLLFAPAFPYWFVIPLPYLALAMVQRAARLKAVVLVEGLWTLAITFCHMIHNYWTWDWSTWAPGILPRLFGTVDRLAYHVTWLDLLKAAGLDALKPVAYSIAVVAGGALLVLLSPLRALERLDEPGDPFRKNRALLVLRALVALGVCSVAAVVYLFCRAHGLK